LDPSSKGRRDCVARPALPSLAKSAVAASSCLANKQLARIHQIHRLKRSSGAWICLPLNPNSTWPGSLAQSAAGRMTILENKYVTKGVAKTMSCFEI